MNINDLVPFHSLFAQAFVRMAAEYPESIWKDNKRALFSHAVRSELYDLIEKNAGCVGTLELDRQAHRLNQAVRLNDTESNVSLRVRKGVALEEEGVAQEEIWRSQALDFGDFRLPPETSVFAEEYVLVWDLPAFDGDHEQISPVQIKIAKVLEKQDSNRLLVAGVQQIPADIEPILGALPAFVVDNETGLEVVTLEEDLGS